MNHFGKSFIGGRWVEPRGSQVFELVNPATEQPITSLRAGSVEDVDAAVKAARAAFPAFADTPVAQRLALLERIVECFQAREAEVLAAITREMGAPCSNKGMTGAAIDGFKAAHATLRDYRFEHVLGPNLVRREAIGVCGLITAWNWPAQLLATKAAYALAAGCTMVLKPSEFTPMTAHLVTEILDEAGVPPGVFNLVHGDGPTVGNAICRHPEVDCISFTGSTRAGVQIGEAAAATIKRVALELGGKSANIVLPDADLALAAEWNVTRAFSNTGQSCHAPTRMLVHESQVDEVLRLISAAVSRVRVGDPLDPATTMGPLVNQAQFERVQRYIRIGLDEGARLVCGGLGRPEGLATGYYVRPTVFADVTPAMTIAQEEIFGPVIAVLAYRTEDEALAIANGTPYGLGGYVFTRDAARGTAVGRRLRAGRVFLNGVPSNPMAPMGGYKRSGNGREMGPFGLEEYLEVKAMIGFPLPTDAG
ncbi:aldehyde dehydrogenase family protein [Piscinibacter defluvii]|uniref:aldehyde dehydrogenase family protein n=1 Tax=Piscinibacter defluvii TaxID=1796922 RepID=UPI000FDE99DE|nr:aldehyde dehydrogenase family protein [Piscinibacter defluvii]